MNKNFIYGFFCALIIISFILASQYGDHFNFLKADGKTILFTFGEGLNWKTLVFLSTIFILFFKNLNDGTIINQIFNTLMFMIFSWSIFDTLWIIKAYFMGNFLFGSNILVSPTIKEIIIGFSRNLFLFSSSIFFAKRFLKFSKNTFIAFLFFIGYWLFLFSGFLRDLSSPSKVFLPMYNPIYYFFNFLPFITSFKEGIKKSWIKFLFA